MKKILSLILSVIMLISVFAFGSFNSIAATKAAAPSISLNQTTEITAIPKTEAEEKAEYANSYYVKFTAPSNGCYLFSFDKAYNVQPSQSDDTAVVMAYLEDSKGENAGMGMAMSFSGMSAEETKMAKELGISNNPSFTVDLKAKTVYYLLITQDGKSDYVTNLKIESHKHSLKSETRKAEVDGDFNMEGGIYYVCTNQYCDYEELDEEFPAVQYINLKQTKVTYDGKAKKPAAVITLTNGNKISSKYYSVKYKNNTKVGKATAEITFKGHYTGKVTKTFKIVPKKTEIKNLTSKKKAITVKYNKQTTQTTGYEIQIATNKGFSKNKKTVVVKKNKTISKTVSKLKAKKKYFVRVRTYKTVNGKKYYSSWSKVKTVKTK